MLEVADIRQDEHVVVDARHTGPPGDAEHHGPAARRPVGDGGDQAVVEGSSNGSRIHDDTPFL